MTYSIISTAPTVINTILDNADFSARQAAFKKYSAPPATTGTDDLIVLGVEKGGREGGQRAVVLDHPSDTWAREESYLIKGKAAVTRSYTSDEETQARAARLEAYGIVACIEKYLRDNPKVGGAEIAEVENVTLEQSVDSGAATHTAEAYFYLRITSLI